MSRLATAYIGFLVTVVAAARFGCQPAQVTVGGLQQWQDLTTPGCFLAAVWLGSRRWLTGMWAVLGKERGMSETLGERDGGRSDYEAPRADEPAQVGTVRSPNAYTPYERLCRIDEAIPYAAHNEALFFRMCVARDAAAADCAELASAVGAFLTGLWAMYGRGT